MIRGTQRRTSRHATAKSISIKSAGCKSGGCVRKAVELTSEICRLSWNRAGERVMASIARFLSRKLKLQVNQQKSAVARPWARKFPGFGVSIERMAGDLTQYLRGWLGYFGKWETPSTLERLEEWTRRRLRSAIWKQWKRGTVRFAELRKRGVGKDLAAQTARSAIGPWRIADSPGLHIALPNAYFDSLGIPRFTAR